MTDLLRDLAHELFSAAQLAPSEGIEDGAARLTAILSAEIARNAEDAKMLDFLGSRMCGASDSERYLPFRIYWGGGTHRDIRHAISKAMKESGE